MKRSKDFIIQIATYIILIGLFSIFANNLTVNLTRNNMLINFDWLKSPAGFAMAESALPFKPSDSYLWAIIIGWLNSLKVIFSGLILATLLGLVTGVSRTSKNILLRTLSSTYIGLIRQVPLLLQLFFWYFVGFLSLSNSSISLLGSLVSISNHGIQILGINLSAEFSALLIGLTVFTGASIAEVIRGGINSVPMGQWEAFRSLGISEIMGISKVIVPQALPAILPGLTSQYLNLAKNSTLAIAVGYSDIYAISDTSITQTGRAIEGFFILMVSFLLLNLLITEIMELINKLILNSN